jgi:integrase
MLAVLEKAKVYNDTPYVFPGKGTHEGLSNNAFLQFLKKQFPGFEGTPHGIRSTFRDWAEEQGKYGHRVIETALAHQLKSKVERAYLRTTMLEQRRTLMDDWNIFLKLDTEYA